MRYVRRFFAAILRVRSWNRPEQLELNLWPKKRR